MVLDAESDEGEGRVADEAHTVSFPRAYFNDLGFAGIIRCVAEGVVARFAVYENCFGFAGPDEGVCDEAFLNGRVVFVVEVLEEEGTFIVVGVGILVGGNILDDDHAACGHCLKANMGVVEIGARVADLRSDSVVEVFERCYWPLRHLRCAV